MLLPDVSMDNPFGLYSVALDAIPPSPLYVVEPVPAYVMIIPVDAEIFRTRLLPMSLTYKLPLDSIVIPVGPLIVAEVAWPPSPEKLLTPVPAMVEIMLIECGLNVG